MMAEFNEDREEGWREGLHPVCVWPPDMTLHPPHPHPVTHTHLQPLTHTYNLTTSLANSLLFFRASQICQRIYELRLVRVNFFSLSFMCVFTVTVCCWSLSRQPAVPLWKELRAHSDQFLGWTETTHTQHTGTTRSQSLDLHPVPIHC